MLLRAPGRYALAAWGRLLPPLLRRGQMAKERDQALAAGGCCEGARPLVARWLSGEARPNGVGGAPPVAVVREGTLSRVHIDESLQ